MPYKHNKSVDFEKIYAFIVVRGSLKPSEVSKRVRKNVFLALISIKCEMHIY